MRERPSLRCLLRTAFGLSLLFRAQVWIAADRQDVTAIIPLQSHTKYDPSSTLMNMRTSRIFSITMPPEMAKQAVRLAQKENRSMSELMREALRRYQQQVSTVDMREYVRMIAPPASGLSAVREEAKRKGTDKMTLRQIDREIKSARGERSKRATKRPGK